MDEQTWRDLVEYGPEILALIPFGAQLLFWSGLMGLLLTSIWFLVRAFEIHWGWGLACVLPLVGLVAPFVLLARHPARVWRPLVGQLVATVVAAAGLWWGAMALQRAVFDQDLGLAARSGEAVVVEGATIALACLLPRGAGKV